MASPRDRPDHSSGDSPPSPGAISPSPSGSGAPRGAVLTAPGLM